MYKKIVVKGIILYHLWFNPKKYKNTKYKIQKRANKIGIGRKAISIIRNKLWYYVKRSGQLAEKQSLMLCNGTYKYLESDYKMLVSEIEYTNSQIGMIAGIISKIENQQAIQ